jgi:hypothetical protein
MQNKLVIKIILIFLIICFFCPFFLVSCQGEEVAKISGTNIAFGTTIEGEHVDGNIFFLLLLLIPIAVLIIAFIKPDILNLSGSIGSFLCLILLFIAKGYATNTAEKYNCTVESRFGFVTSIICYFMIIFLQVYGWVKQKGFIKGTSLSSRNFCPGCGNKLTANEKFCAKCGRKII